VLLATANVCRSHVSLCTDRSLIILVLRYRSAADTKIAVNGCGGDICAVTLGGQKNRRVYIALFSNERSALAKPLCCAMLN